MNQFISHLGVRVFHHVLLKYGQEKAEMQHPSPCIHILDHHRNEKRGLLLVFFCFVFFRMDVNHKNHDYDSRLGVRKYRKWVLFFTVSLQIQSCLKGLLLDKLLSKGKV